MKPQVAQRGRGGHQADPERWKRTLIVGAVVAVIVVALGFAGFGLYDHFIRPLGKTVLRVEDTKFNLAHLERRMRLMRDENPFSFQQTENLILLPDIVLGQLEREAKLLEGAGELNITVSEEEVAAEIRQQGNLAEEVEESLYAAEFSRQVKSRGLKPNEYWQMLRAGLLGEKVSNYFLYLAPQEEPQVRARWIVVDDHDLADETLERLEAGEEFADVASEVSLDPATAEQGGELDWRPRGTFPEDIEDFLFGAEPGQRSEIISFGSFLYIAELLEREDNRALDEQQRQQVANREMNDWLDGLDATLDVELDFTAEDLDRALGDVFG